MPKAIGVAKAVAMAELEIKGEYNELKHDPFFKEFDAAGLDERDLAMFPDYLVLIGAEQLQGAENDKLAEILSAGLPVKILVQTDDLLEASPLGDTHLAFGLRSKQLANMAIGLNDIYVLQSSSSNLFQFRERILKGMNYSGPAVFSVFSGCGGKTGDLPPYLVAAAAMESRAFPAFTYDPSAGANWASRFYLEANSQVELDWPAHDFTYENEAHQSVSESVAFTLIDFVACDHRYSRHFARLPREKWNGGLASVAECVARETRGAPDKVPCILMVDRDNVLQKIVVDEKLVRAAQRCRETWHSVQELGGIHNSHAEQLLAREKKVWEEHERSELAARAPEAQPAAKAAAPAEAAAPAAAGAPVEVEEKKSDDPYIETARCSTCNECTMINDKMFAYNENKQAYIKDPRAGTYAQLVEAAESCQLGIIHPGKPLNPNEPGLAELIQRAEPFQ